jgi:hypothetical protein
VEGSVYRSASSGTPDNSETVAVAGDVVKLGGGLINLAQMPVGRLCSYRFLC